MPELLPDVPEVPDVPEELLLLAELVVLLALLEELGVSSPLQPTIMNKEETHATTTTRRNIALNVRKHKRPRQQPDAMTRKLRNFPRQPAKPW